MEQTMGRYNGTLAITDIQTKDMCNRGTSLERSAEKKEKKKKKKEKKKKENFKRLVVKLPEVG